MSAPATSFSRISIPSGCAISSVTPRLLVLRYRNSPLVSGFGRSPGNGPRVRDRSPTPGRSTLMTSAPMSASNLLQYGAETSSPTSMIFRLDKAPAIDTPSKRDCRILFGEDLPERLHFNAREHSIGRVRIAVRERNRLRLALRIHNDKTAAAVGERSRQLHFAGAIQRPQIREMSLPDLGPQRSAVGSVMADDHEQHRIILPRKTAVLSLC